MQPAPTARPRSRRQRLLLVLAIIVAALLLLGVLRSGALAGAPEFHGTAYDPPAEAADFTLTNHEGQETSLSDFEGQPVLLFFGYTHCPDICPTTLNTLRRALTDAGAAGADARVLLVSVDPARDTPDVLADYVRNFGPGVVGLTGDPGKIRRLFGAYGVYAEHEHEHADEGLIGHTSAVFGIDREGLIRVLLRPDAPPSELREDVATLLAL
jgi:protein SCO1/2